MLVNLLNALFNRDVGLNVRAKKEAPSIAPVSKVPELAKLEEYTGGELKAGTVIEISLHEILDLIPPANPNRRRKDSYDRLVRKLRSIGVELRIISGHERQ